MRKVFAEYARSHCPSVLRTRACFLPAGRSKALLELAFRSVWRQLRVRHQCSSMIFCSFEATERSKSLLERALRPLSARKHCSSMRLFHSEALSSILLFPSKALSSMFFPFESTFDNASVSFEIPFEIALLRTVHCFELRVVRSQRSRKAPYANIVNKKQKHAHTHILNTILYIHIF